MEGWLGPGSYVGFCGNCRPVRRWADVVDLLANFTPTVRRELRCAEPVGVGLWLPAELVNLRRTIAANEIAEQQAALAAAGGRDCGVFTLNGFPYGDFQGERVKHDVYWPDWTTVERAAYTADLIRCAGEFAPQLKQFSISTLPIGWRESLAVPGDVEKAARLLRTTADVLREHHERTGRLVHLDIEPEPGCLLETSDDVIRFFETYLLDRHTEHVVRRYLRVCHDVCHAAVMGEPQEQAFRNYAAAGIEVGKVQISSALEADFERRSTAERAALLTELRAFAEPRFLHQTVIHAVSADAAPHSLGRGPSAYSGPATFFEDLPQALAAAGNAPAGRWRVHFHVPIHLERIGKLDTTQHEIGEALRAARLFSKCRHFEVETYAWSVLPQELREADMAVGVARELRWLRELIQRENLAGLADD